MSYILKEPIAHVKSAMINKVSESHYILFVNTTISSNTSDYVAKSLTGAKIVFAKFYAKGAKWIYSKDPD